MSLEDSYSKLDRWFHGLAFSSRAFQLTAADMESAFFGARFRDVETYAPIFVTSLPRAGTTLMLEVLHQVGSLSTHVYRDMPFVFAPILWERWSAGFRKRAELVERAHGDGMLVGFDSPEAFEEVFWRMFFPKHFRKDSISLWADDQDCEEFQEFFADHMKKIVALRTAGAASSVPVGRAGAAVRGRYMSKNNANVARVGLLKRIFPDSVVLVPFRHPFDQATSLIQQHRKFLKVHGEEAFSRRYMHDIGHLEFGELHRPIAFPGMEEVRTRYEPDTLDYWIGYWVVAFEHLLAIRQHITFVSYERLCIDKTASVAALCSALGLSSVDFGTLAADVFRAPRSSLAKVVLQDPELQRRADAAHEQLLSLSIL